MLDRNARHAVADAGALSGARPSECGSHIGPRWYVAQTHPNAERLAMVELANQDFASLAPLRRIEPQPRPSNQPRRHRKREDGPRTTLAFPGYLFVLFDRDAQPWRCIHHTRGVKRLFSLSEDRPIPVPIGVVERLMAKLAKDLSIALPHKADDPIPDGALVRVLSGPLAGSEAICLRSSPRGPVHARMLATGWQMELPREALSVLDGQR
jgi:transcription antitermination factor NusG